MSCYLLHLCVFPSTYVCIFLPPSLSISLFFVPSSSQLPTILPPLRGYVVGCQGCVLKPRRTTVESGTRQGHGYQALISFPFFLSPLFPSLSLSLFLLFLLSPSSLSFYLFLFYVFPFFSHVHISWWQPSWGICNVIRHIQNNNELSSPLPLTFHFHRILRSAICMSDPMHIARYKEKGFPSRAHTEFCSFYSFRHLEIFLLPPLLLSTPPLFPYLHHRISRYLNPHVRMHQHCVCINRKNL